jgi:ankyrin repeat protein
MRKAAFIASVIVLVSMTGLWAAGTPEVAKAAKSGNAAAVRALIAKKADVNAPEADGTTALHWAVRANDLATTQLLIRAGANVKAANHYNATPLWLAATNGNAAILEALIKAGADPKATVSEGETTLMTAARTGNVDAVKVLLAYGADVNAKESWYGQTALMWAVIENNAAAAKLLIEGGADLAAKTTIPQARGGRGGGGDGSKGGFTPLLFAARQGSVEAGKVLIDAGADPNLGDPDNITPMIAALLSGHYDFAGMLIQNGADVNAADRTGRAPLYTAVDMHSLEWRFNRPAPKKAEKQYDSAAIVKMLLARGADVNAELNAGIMAPSRAATGNRNLTKGSTPFLKAATTSDVEMMRLLLDWGADPYVTNQAHTNALMMVAGLNWQPQASVGPQDDAVEAARLLLDLGFDINATNDQGQTALHGVASRTEERDANKLIQFLVDHGADLYARTKAGAPAGRGGAAAAGAAPPPPPNPGRAGPPTVGQTPLDISKGGLDDVDAMGNPSTRPANHRTMALLEQLMKTHPAPPSFQAVPDQPPAQAAQSAQ